MRQQLPFLRNWITALGLLAFSSLALSGQLIERHQQCMAEGAGTSGLGEKCAQASAELAQQLQAQYQQQFLRKSPPNDAADRTNRSAVLARLSNKWDMMVDEQCQAQATWVSPDQATPCTISLREAQLAQLQALAENSTGEFVPCESAPNATDMARGCYSRTSLWARDGQQLELWQPEASWRGQAETGDENKPAAALVWKSGDQSEVVSMWCAQACASMTQQPLQLPVADLVDKLLIWQLDSAKATRHGPIGDVLAFKLSDKSLATLAINMHAPAHLSAQQLLSTKNLLTCDYTILQTQVFLARDQAMDANDYLTVRLPQPIAVQADCATPAFDPATPMAQRIQALRRLAMGLPTPDLRGEVSLFGLNHALAPTEPQSGSSAAYPDHSGDQQTADSSADGEGSSSTQPQAPTPAQ